MNMVKIQEVKGRLSVTLPAQIAKIKSWKKEDELFFSIDPHTGKVALEKLEDIAKREY